MKNESAFVAFLRGINVGGSNLLPMNELSEICAGIGFEEVRTYIQSGNVIFKSELPENKLKEKLEKALFKKKGKEIPVAIRSAAQLKTILSRNPFPKANPSRVGVLILPKSVPKNLPEEIAISGSEEVIPARREIYIHYPDGMGRSKLKLPGSVKEGTMRNINTLTRLAGLMN